MNELSLLAGIAAVYHDLGFRHERLDNAELFFDAPVGYQLDAETGRYHGERPQGPLLPLVGIFVGFFQGAEVSVGPGHLVAIAFEVAVVSAFGAYNIGNLFGNTGLFGNAHFHNGSRFFLKFYECKGTFLFSFGLDFSTPPFIGRVER